MDVVCIGKTRIVELPRCVIFADMVVWNINEFDCHFIRFRSNALFYVFNFLISQKEQCNLALFISKTETAFNGILMVHHILMVHFINSSKLLSREYLGQCTTCQLRMQKWAICLQASIDI